MYVAITLGIASKPLISTAVLLLRRSQPCNHRGREQYVLGTSLQRTTVLTIFQAFLIVSEASLFRSYFARNWPLLSPLHGFVTLGLAMLVLGVNILGNLNKEATSQENIGLAFWRIVIGAGILVTILGFFNIIAVCAAAPGTSVHTNP